MGDTSTAKTSNVRYLAARAGKRYTYIQINSQTDEIYLFGTFQPEEVKLDLEQAKQILAEYKDYHL